MAEKVRIQVTDEKERWSTSAWVIWGSNHIMQRRQFGFDGVQWFYQPTTREAFIKVAENLVPIRVKENMAEHCKPEPPKQSTEVYIARVFDYRAGRNFPKAWVLFDNLGRRLASCKKESMRDMVKQWTAKYGTPTGLTRFKGLMRLSELAMTMGDIIHKPQPKES